MTWKELAKRISKLSEKQQNTDVTVLDTEVFEAFPINDLLTKSSEDFGLEDGHPYLTIRDQDLSFSKQVAKLP